MILYNDRVAGGSRYVPGLSLLPYHGLKEVIAANLDVRRAHSGAASAKQNILTGTFQEIVDDLESSRRFVAVATAHRSGVRAFPCACHAIESVEIGIDHGNRASALHHSDALAHFGTLARMHPVAVDD